ncbi:XRE family transcriptional regulator [Hydrogenovibrio sp. SC-1]|uniref:MbcA/ParS/Xre antitoxin family protein n=1 Tax=Hydrogenovibrio sp. SC-1 TaxID=2065820 RepID=UPI000C7E3BC1|nr:MbcA/ParS/Xre antitoxin family protein [Hydrogenovibrio sp. SC-1]PLA73686.1 XRE family transcriptional regulator [Hydrogenovibrio sp. SC-1]
MAMVALERKELNKTQVVAKALINLKEELRLSSESVGQIIGADASTVFRIGKNMDMKENKVFEGALLLIRVYRSLFALLGGDKAAMIHWLTTANKDFAEQRPIEHIKSLVGLVEVVQYLDAMRGHA